MKYQFVKAHCRQFSIERMCRVLQVSKSGYYHFLRRCLSQRALENEQLKQRIQQIYSESRRCYGSPRIHAELKAQNIRCGKHKVARLMRQLGIQAKVHRRRKYNPFAHENYDQGKDRVKRKFTVSKPNTVWVSDITYIATQEGWVYVVVILDLFSRKVVGFHCSAHMDKTLVIIAFEQATQVRRPPEGLIFHSDRGMQYVNDSFQDYLNRQGVLSSMSRKGNCWDNGAPRIICH